MPCLRQTSTASPLTGTLPTATMHPDITNPSFDTVSHHAIGLLWGRHQQRTLDGRLNFLQAREAALFLQFIRRRIHGNHVIPALTQLAKKHPTEILGIA